MEKTMKKALLLALLVLLAAVSMLVVAERAARAGKSQQNHASLDEKTNTVLRLSASATLASWASPPSRTTPPHPSRKS
jgi:Tfp pilus assembly protein PilW